MSRLINTYLLFAAPVLCSNGTQPVLWDDNLSVIGLSTLQENGFNPPGTGDIVSTFQGKDNLIFTYAVTNDNIENPVVMTFKTYVISKTNDRYGLQFILTPQSGDSDIIYSVSIYIFQMLEFNCNSIYVKINC